MQSSPLPNPPQKGGNNANTIHLNKKLLSFKTGACILY